MSEEEPSVGSSPVKTPSPILETPMSPIQCLMCFEAFSSKPELSAHVIQCARSRGRLNSARSSRVTSAAASANGSRSTSAAYVADDEQAENTNASTNSTSNRVGTEEEEEARLPAAEAESEVGKRREDHQPLSPSCEFESAPVGALKFDTNEEEEPESERRRRLGEEEQEESPPPIPNKEEERHDSTTEEENAPPDSGQTTEEEGKQEDFEKQNDQQQEESDIVQKDSPDSNRIQCGGGANDLLLGGAPLDPAILGTEVVSLNTTEDEICVRNTQDGMLVEQNDGDLEFEYNPPTEENTKVASEKMDPDDSEPEPREPLTHSPHESSVSPQGGNFIRTGGSPNSTLKPKSVSPEGAMPTYHRMSSASASPTGTLRFSSTASALSLRRQEKALRMSSYSHELLSGTESGSGHSVSIAAIEELQATNLAAANLYAKGCETGAPKPSVAAMLAPPSPPAKAAPTTVSLNASTTSTSSSSSKGAVRRRVSAGRKSSASRLAPASNDMGWQKAALNDLEAMQIENQVKMTRSQSAIQFPSKDRTAAAAAPNSGSPLFQTRKAEILRARSESQQPLEGQDESWGRKVEDMPTMEPTQLAGVRELTPPHSANDDDGGDTPTPLADKPPPRNGADKTPTQRFSRGSGAKSGSSVPSPMIFKGGSTPGPVVGGSSSRPTRSTPGGSASKTPANQRTRISESATRAATPSSAKVFLSPNSWESPNQVRAPIVTFATSSNLGSTVDSSEGGSPGSTLTGTSTAGTLAAAGATEAGAESPLPTKPVPARRSLSPNVGSKSSSPQHRTVTSAENSAATPSRSGVQVHVHRSVSATIGSKNPSSTTDSRNVATPMRRSFGNPGAASGGQQHTANTGMRAALSTSPSVSQRRSESSKGVKRLSTGQASTTAAAGGTTGGGIVTTGPTSGAALSSMARPTPNVVRPRRATTTARSSTSATPYAAPSVNLRAVLGTGTREGTGVGRRSQGPPAGLGADGTPAPTSKQEMSSTAAPGGVVSRPSYMAPTKSHASKYEDPTTPAVMKAGPNLHRNPNAAIAAARPDFATVANINSFLEQSASEDSPAVRSSSPPKVVRRQQQPASGSSKLSKSSSFSAGSSGGPKFVQTAAVGASVLESSMNNSSIGSNSSTQGTSPTTPSKVAGGPPPPATVKQLQQPQSLVRAAPPPQQLVGSPEKKKRTTATATASATTPGKHQSAVKSGMMGGVTRVDSYHSNPSSTGSAAARDTPPPPTLYPLSQPEKEKPVAKSSETQTRAAPPPQQLVGTPEKKRTTATTPTQSPGTQTQVSAIGGGHRVSEKVQRSVSIPAETQTSPTVTETAPSPGPSRSPSTTTTTTTTNPDHHHARTVSGPSKILFCPECGERFLQAGKFCAFCGTKRPVVEEPEL